MNSGTFATALKVFRSILHQVCLLAVTNQKDEKVIKALISKVKEYITGIRIELERRKLKESATTDEDKIREAELACYFTVCQMDERHRVLALKSAVTILYKMGNFITAGHCA